MRTLAAALLFLSLTAPAQTRQRDHLKFVLILSRHGIRPPLQANATLNRYSADPWPTWPVGLGQLTPHGADALRLQGAWLRKHYAALHLLPANGCAPANALYLYSDTDQRDLASDRALDEGMFPNCPHTAIYAVAPGSKDPLFARALRPAEDPIAAAASLRARVGDPASITERFRPQLEAFAHILAPDPAHPAQESVLTIPPAIVTGTAQPGTTAASPRGPVFASSSMLEDLFLEYLDAKPLDSVGWGRLDTPTLTALRNVHAYAFRTAYGDGYIGRAENSNLLSHMLDTLEQAAASTGPSTSTLSSRPQRSAAERSPHLPSSVPTNPASSRPKRSAVERPAFSPLAAEPAGLTVIAGHDDNLAAFGGVFGLHWHADGVDDETPPGSEIVLELWQNPRTHRQAVRLYYRAVATAGQRNLTPLTRRRGPNEVPLQLPHCALACPLADFLSQTRTALDPHFVLPLAPAAAQEPPPAAPPLP